MRYGVAAYVVAVIGGGAGVGYLVYSGRAGVAEVALAAGAAGGELDPSQLGLSNLQVQAGLNDEGKNDGKSKGESGQVRIMGARETSFSYSRESELDELWHKRLKNTALTMSLSDQDDEQVETTLRQRYEGQLSRVRQTEPEDVFGLFMAAIRWSKHLLMPSRSLPCG